MVDRYATCPWCGRSIGSRPADGVLYKHDNRNNSGFCKGSLCLLVPDPSADWEPITERDSRGVATPVATPRDVDGSGSRGAGS